MYTEIANCRACQSPLLREVFDLGQPALSGRFPGPDEPDAPVGPVTLVLCEECGLGQLAHDYEHDELYRHNYGYRSGINATMSNHLAQLVGDILGRRTLAPGDIVLDIGSNDATLLGCYDNSQIRRIGMDPTIAQYREYYSSDILAVADYFSADSFAAISPGKASIITSIAMFYDLSDPNKFVADIASSLAEDGLWVLELCYAKRMIEMNAFDTICHEHATYYGLELIANMVKAHGLHVCDVSFSDVNGGSFRIFVCHQKSDFQVSRSVEMALQEEKKFGLGTAEKYLEFRDNIEIQMESLRRLVNSLKSEGKSIYAYGASTKGNILLQYCGFSSAEIEAAVDRNPVKWGRRTPGTNIPIISEADARLKCPDYMLVLPWHFRDEFIEREADYFSGGGHMIFPLPTVEVI